MDVLGRWCFFFHLWRYSASSLWRPLFLWSRHVHYVVIHCVAVIELWYWHIQHGYEWEYHKIPPNFMTPTYEYLWGFSTKDFPDVKNHQSLWSSTAPASCNHRHLKDEALRGVVLCLLDTGHGRTAIEAVKIESCFLLCTGRFWKILQEDQDSIITWRLNFPKCISFLCTWIKPLGGRQAPAGLRLSYGTTGSCVMWCNGGQ